MRKTAAATRSTPLPPRRPIVPDVAIGSRLIGRALHIRADQPGARRHLEPLVRSRVPPARPLEIRLITTSARCSIPSTRAFSGCREVAIRQSDSPWLMLARRITCSRRFTRGLATAPVGSRETVEPVAPSSPREFASRRARRGSRRCRADCRGVGCGRQGAARAEQTEARWYLAELLRTKGLLLLEQGPTAIATAEQCFDQALDVARRQGALWWELRAAMSLARLWRGQGRGSHARKLLAAVYRRFPERFGTVDLITAKALLASLR